MSEVDHAIYARATRPALEPAPITVEDEAQGLARQINATKGGEKLFNVGRVAAEIKVLENKGSPLGDFARLRGRG